MDRWMRSITCSAPRRATNPVDGWTDGARSNKYSTEVTHAFTTVRVNGMHILYMFWRITRGPPRRRGEPTTLAVGEQLHHFIKLGWEIIRWMGLDGWTKEGNNNTAHSAAGITHATSGTHGMEKAGFGRSRQKRHPPSRAFRKNCLEKVDHASCIWKSFCPQCNFFWL